ncbi:ORF258 [White spot syndrome virus]|uniref:ORF258 n=1 Tax=White spot syndrome virus TaxID=342409 RepID=A0A2D3I6D0_9VIRU|nr:ORF258 [White spot syndrome virus]
MSNAEEAEKIVSARGTQTPSYSSSSSIPYSVFNSLLDLTQVPPPRERQLMHSKSLPPTRHFLGVLKQSNVL